jgi:hypothetical protein
LAVGKKSAPKVRETANESALAKVSTEKWGRYKTLYTGIEKDSLARANQDASKVLRGRATADVAQAAAGGMEGAIGLGQGSVSKLAPTAASVGAARTLGAASATRAADEVQMKGRLGMLATGQGLAGDAQSGLAAAARASSTEALAKARAQHTVNEGYKQALGTLATGATGAYMDNKANKRYKEQVEANNAMLEAMK